MLQEAYEIKDGKIGKPLKGATLIGNGPEALKEVSMVGNNLELDQELEHAEKTDNLFQWV